MTEDEKLFAWLDGELGSAEAAEMQAKVASNPELARLAQQHRAFSARLRDAFDPIAAAPVPERFQAELRETAEVVDFASAKRARTMPSVTQWMSIAASLAVGVFVGTMVPREVNAPLQVADGKIFAAAELNQALNTELASAPAGKVRIAVTFRDHAGQICRSFTAYASSGLACRSNGRWQLKGLFAAPEGQTSDYRMAAGMNPNSLPWLMPRSRAKHSTPRRSALHNSATGNNRNGHICVRMKTKPSVVTHTREGNDVRSSIS